MKLNKKGFTLIELLAVVAIVALLAVIAIPNVVKYYDAAETRSFIAQGQYLYKAAAQQFVQDRIKTGAKPNGIVYDNVSNPLKLQGGGENLVHNIKVNSDGEVSYMDLTDGTWSIKIPADADPSSNIAVPIDNISEETIVAVGDEGGGSEGGGSTDPDIADVNPETTNPDGTYDPNTPGIPDAINFESLESETDWETGCWKNTATESELDSKRLNCKILDDNRKCEDLTKFCNDTQNHVNYYVQNSADGIDYTKISSDSNGKGLYYTESETEGHRVFFYRGNVTNNYVQFAGTLWRIIRIDERGNIRMMKDEINTSASDYITTWNTETNATYKMKMSFMYGTSSSSPYTPTNNSTIKMALDRIYGKNFDQSVNQIWENFLSDPGYCNDKSGDTAPSSFQASVLNKKAIDLNSEYVSRTTHPTYKCAKEIDNYTTKTSTFGNKALAYKFPIALITYDELLFAGGYLNKTNTSFYLSKPNNYWTLTPYRFLGAACVYSCFPNCYYTNTCGSTGYPCNFHSTQYSYAYYFLNSGEISTTIEGYSYYKATSSCSTSFKLTSSPSYYIYPVISLKPTVKFTLASETNPGTKDNPYIVGPTNKTWVD